MCVSSGAPMPPFVASPPLHYGFNVYRLDRSLADELDLDEDNTPDIGMLLSVVSGG